MEIVSIFKKSVDTLSLLFKRLYELNQKWCGHTLLKLGMETFNIEFAR